MSARLYTVAPLIAAALAACGASQTGPTESTARCMATCDDIELRGPLAACALSPTSVLVVAGTPSGRVVRGVARVEDGRWDAASLDFAPLDVPRVVTMACAPRPEGGAVLALGTARAITLHSVDSDGSLSTWERAPSRHDVRARELGVAVASNGEAIVAYVDAEGVAHVEGGSAIESVPARDVAIARSGGRVLFAWSDDDGVRLSDGARVTHVDTGARDGEADHVVGASLAIAGGDRPTLAYQDQTSGALVTSTGTSRADHGDPDVTRAMHVAVVALPQRVLVLDLAARSRPRLRMELRVETLR